MIFFRFLLESYLESSLAKKTYYYLLQFSYYNTMVMKSCTQPVYAITSGQFTRESGSRVPSVTTQPQPCQISRNMSSTSMRESGTEIMNVQ